MWCIRHTESVSISAFIRWMSAALPRIIWKSPIRGVMFYMFLWIRWICFPNMSAVKRSSWTAWEEQTGVKRKAVSRQQQQKWQSSWWRSMRRVSVPQGMRFRRTPLGSAILRIPFYIRKRTISCKVLRKWSRIWSVRVRWTGFYAEMSGTGKPRWRFVLLLKRWWIPSRWHTFVRPQFLPCSSTIIFVSGCRAFRSGLRCFPASVRRHSRRKFWKN